MNKTTTPKQKYKCIQCGVIFTKTPQLKSGKFNSGACYRAYRKAHGTLATLEAVPCPVNDAGEINASIVPSTDPVSKEQLVENISQDQQNANTDVVDFEDLSLSELRSILSSLLEQAETLSEENAVLKKKLEERESTGLTKLVEQFLEGIVGLQLPPVETLVTIVPAGSKKCVGCKKVFVPVNYDEQFFCSPECAKNTIPPNSVIILHDKTIVEGRKVPIKPLPEDVKARIEGVA